MSPNPSPADLVSSLSRSVSRRSALRWTAAVALGTVGFGTVSACSTDEDTAATIDTLTTHLRRARSDAATAGALIAVVPDRAGALAVVQAERSAHADALATEIDRVAGGAGVASSTSAAATTVQAPPPTLDELRISLTDAQRGAADSALNESGYRAGLLGSISAACAVEVSVVLA